MVVPSTRGIMPVAAEMTGPLHKILYQGAEMAYQVVEMDNRTAKMYYQVAEMDDQDADTRCPFRKSNCLLKTLTFGKIVGNKF